MFPSVGARGEVMCLSYGIIDGGLHVLLRHRRASVLLGEYPTASIFFLAASPTKENAYILANHSPSIQELIILMDKIAQFER